MVSPQRVPEIVPGLDIRALPLTAVDGFVLSRIDGRSSALDIVSLTGLDLAQVSTILERLEALGIVRFRPTQSTMPGRSHSDVPTGSHALRPDAPPRRATSDNPSDPPTGVHAQRVAATSDRPSRSSPPRRNPTQRPAPRRMMTESGYSSPPPDVPQHPRAPSAHPSGPPTSRLRAVSVPPEATTGRPPAQPAHPESRRGAVPDEQLSGSREHPVSVERVRPQGARTEARAPTQDDARAASTDRTDTRMPPPRTDTRLPPANGETRSAAREVNGTPEQRAREQRERVESKARASAPAGGRTPFSASMRPPQGPAMSMPPPRRDSGTPGSASSEGKASSQPPEAQGPVPPPYDLRELDEDVDLPMERRKQILDLFYRLSELDYYEALGVPYDAEKKLIRSSYFQLSKAFHPDSMFRKKLGSFKTKMEQVFQYLTEAYETLGKNKNRDEYDAYLRATKAAKMVEQKLRRDLEPGPNPAAAHMPRPPITPPPPPPPLEPEVVAEAVAPPREVSQEARRLARDVIERRMRGLTGSNVRHVGDRPPPPPPDAPSEASGQPADPHELLRRLARTLKDVAKLTGTSEHLVRAMKSSQVAFARGDLAEAAQQMSKAVALAPERADLRLDYERVAKLLSEKLANDYAQAALFEMKNNKWGSAGISWAKVCEARPADAEAHRQASLCLFKAGADLRGAQKYAQQAAFLAPDDIEARLLLAQIYLTLGLKLNAKRELDNAAKLDPENEMVKNLLADLKG